jgi:hypothetical protein
MTTFWFKNVKFWGFFVEKWKILDLLMKKGKILVIFGGKS